MRVVIDWQRSANSVTWSPNAHNMPGMPSFGPRRACWLAQIVTTG